jgi:CBS domain containing-hemolysin-like protein
MGDQQPPSSGLARFRARLRPAVETAVVSPEAQAIHARVDQLSELELRDVMTPRVDVVGDLDEVEGVLFVNDLFRSTAVKRAIGVSLPTANEIARKIRRPLMLPETLDLLESLKELREQRRTFALVLDEHGGVAGVISIRDILEQLVGDLSDEFDEEDEPEIVRIREDRWLVDGQTHVDKVEEQLGVVIPEGEYVTIAGFILDLAGEIPAAGTTYAYEDWTFRVQSVEKRRISEIVIEYHAPVLAEEPSE